MVNKEDISNALNIALNKSNMSEKCGKPHISSLPGDLRSSDVDLLQSRLTTIDERLGELDDEIAEEKGFQEFAQQNIREAEAENKELHKNLDDYLKKEDDWLKDSEKLQGEALDEASEIRDWWNSLTKSASDTPVQPVLPKMTGTPFNLNTLMGLFGDEFENKALLRSDEVDFIKRMADSVEEYANSGSYDGDINSWTEEGVGLSDAMREFADKYDINNNPNGLGDRLDEVMSIAEKGLPSQWSEKIDSNNEIIRRNQESLPESNRILNRLQREYTDLSDNRVLTERRLNEVK